MQSIGGLFGKFNSKIAAKVQNLVFIIETVKKHTGIALEMKDITISNGVLRIQGTSLQKNEVFMKKEKILKDVAGRGVTDIR